MAGYSVTEKKIETKGRPKTAVCGGCGDPVEAGQLLCQPCKEDAFFAAEAFQVESESSDV